MNAIEIRGLTKSFRGLHAVDDLNMTVPVGAIYGFIGENGSGKSTTQKLICGHLVPNRGTIKLFGKPYTDPGIRARVGALIVSAKDMEGRARVFVSVRTGDMPRSAELLRRWFGKVLEEDGYLRVYDAKAPGILDDLERLRGETVDIALGSPSTLAVGYLASYDGWELAAAIAALKRRHPYVDISAFSGSHDALYEELRQRKADLIFSDKRRVFSDEYVNRPIMSCGEYVEVSEASPLAGREQVSARDLCDLTCIIVASQGQQAIEEDYHRNTLNFECPIAFASSVREARMMVAADQGFLNLEFGGEAGLAGGVIQRIPLVGAEGPVRHDYYAFYPAQNANPFAGEFADILANLFAG